MSYVFVLDTEHRPLDPVHPGHARRLLSRGAVAVWRRYPFTLILKRVVPDAAPAPLRLKIDPGSRITGLAMVTEPAPERALDRALDMAPVAGSAGTEGSAVGRVVWAGELTHRGGAVHDGLETRRAVRRSRRQRHTRYRPSRFANRRRPEGWLPPSQESRLTNTQTWVRRLSRLANVTAISQELVRFDTQAMQNPEIAGVEYQQGTLAGYELREYLLEKWQRRCAYCHTTGVPLQIEHIVPRARAGSDRASNLTLACEPCNLAKGTRTAAEFGHPEVQAQAKLPLRDAAAVNATRWALVRRLRALGLPVETGSGGRTKWNRTHRGLPKTHWLDAACVGASTPDCLIVAADMHPLLMTATGRGRRQMCGTDMYGFPARHRTRRKRHFGFQTGDLVRAVVPPPFKTAGTHVGRVLVRASGSFDVRVAGEGDREGAGNRRRMAGIGYRYMHMLARDDGYTYDACAQAPAGGRSGKSGKSGGSA